MRRPIRWDRPSHEQGFAFTKGFALLGGDYAEQSSEIIVGTSSEEKLVGRAICRGSAT